MNENIFLLGVAFVLLIIGVVNMIQHVKLERGRRMPMRNVYRKR
jgi:hypothetical protein